MGRHRMRGRLLIYLFCFLNSFLGKDLASNRGPPNVSPTWSMFLPLSQGLSTAWYPTDLSFLLSCPPNVNESIKLRPPNAQPYFIPFHVETSFVRQLLQHNSGTRQSLSCQTPGGAGCEPGLWPASLADPSQQIPY